MELVEDNTGMFESETRQVYRCSQCKKRLSFEQSFFLSQTSYSTITHYEINKCQYCGHT